MPQLNLPIKMERFEVCMTYFRGTGRLQGLVMKARASHLCSTGLNPSTISICRWFGGVPAVGCAALCPCGECCSVPTGLAVPWRAQSAGEGAPAVPSTFGSPRTSRARTVCPSVCLPAHKPSPLFPAPAPSSAQRGGIAAAPAQGSSEELKLCTSQQKLWEELKYAASTDFPCGCIAIRLTH